LWASAVVCFQHSSQRHPNNPASFVKLVRPTFAKITSFRLLADGAKAVEDDELIVVSCRHQVLLSASTAFSRFLGLELAIAWLVNARRRNLSGVSLECQNRWWQLPLTTLPEQEGRSVNQP
jgi:hypothetical protein